MSIDGNRERAIDLAVSQIEKQFGKGAIMRLGEAALAQDVACLPTGSLGLDIALGIGGIPRRRAGGNSPARTSGTTTPPPPVLSPGPKSGRDCALLHPPPTLPPGPPRQTR